MVGHLPLEQGIGVRVPDPQQLATNRPCAGFCFTAAGRKVWDTFRQ